MANEYLQSIASNLGISIWLLFAMIIWELSWKLVAMWKSARKGSMPWFIVLALFNTVGIFPILYIFVFSKYDNKIKAKQKQQGKNKKIKRKVKRK